MEFSNNSPASPLGNLPSSAPEPHHYNSEPPSSRLIDKVKRVLRELRQSIGRFFENARAFFSISNRNSSRLNDSDITVIPSQALDNGHPTSKATLTAQHLHSAAHDEFFHFKQEIPQQYQHIQQSRQQILLSCIEAYRKNSESPAAASFPLPSAPFHEEFPPLPSAPPYEELFPLSEPQISKAQAEAVQQAENIHIPLNLNQIELQQLTGPMLYLAQNLQATRENPVICDYKSKGGKEQTSSQIWCENDTLYIQNSTHGKLEIIRIHLSDTDHIETYVNGKSIGKLSETQFNHVKKANEGLAQQLIKKQLSYFKQPKFKNTKEIIDIKTGIDEYDNKVEISIRLLINQLDSSKMEYTREDPARYMIGGKVYCVWISQEDNRQVASVWHGSKKVNIQLEEAWENRAKNSQKNLFSITELPYGILSCAYEGQQQPRAVSSEQLELINGLQKALHPQPQQYIQAPNTQQPRQANLSQEKLYQSNKDALEQTFIALQQGLVSYNTEKPLIVNLADNQPYCIWSLVKDDGSVVFSIQPKEDFSWSRLNGKISFLVSRQVDVVTVSSRRVGINDQLGSVGVEEFTPEQLQLINDAFNAIMKTVPSSSAATQPPKSADSSAPLHAAAAAPLATHNPAIHEEQVPQPQQANLSQEKLSQSNKDALEQTFIALQQELVSYNAAKPLIVDFTDKQSYCIWSSFTDDHRSVIFSIQPREDFSWRKPDGKISFLMSLQADGITISSRRVGNQLGSVSVEEFTPKQLQLINEACNAIMKKVPSYAAAAQPPQTAASSPSLHAAESVLAPPKLATHQERVTSVINDIADQVKKNPNRYHFSGYAIPALPLPSDAESMKGKFIPLKAKMSLQEESQAIAIGYIANRYTWNTAPVFDHDNPEDSPQASVRLPQGMSIERYQAMCRSAQEAAIGSKPMNSDQETFELVMSLQGITIATTQTYNTTALLGEPLPDGHEEPNIHLILQTGLNLAGTRGGGIPVPKSKMQDAVEGLEAYMLSNAKGAAEAAASNKSDVLVFNLGIGSGEFAGSDHKIRKQVLNASLEGIIQAANELRAQNSDMRIIIPRIGDTPSKEQEANLAKLGISVIQADKGKVAAFCARQGLRVSESIAGDPMSMLGIHGPGFWVETVGGASDEERAAVTADIYYSIHRTTQISDASGNALNVPALSQYMLTKNAVI